jgi:hypothetical protein
MNYRMLFPLPCKGVNGKRGLPGYGAEKLPPPLKEGAQGGAEQGLAKTPGPGQKENTARPYRQFMDEGGFVHIQKTAFPDFDKIL